MNISNGTIFMRILINTNGMCLVFSLLSMSVLRDIWIFLIQPVAYWCMSQVHNIYSVNKVILLARLQSNSGLLYTCLRYIEFMEHVTILQLYLYHNYVLIRCSNVYTMVEVWVFGFSNADFLELIFKPLSISLIISPCHNTTITVKLYFWILNQTNCD